MNRMMNNGVDNWSITFFYNDIKNLNSLPDKIICISNKSSISSEDKTHFTY